METHYKGTIDSLESENRTLKTMVDETLRDVNSKGNQNSNARQELIDEILRVE